jgi:hypothetical protein
MWQCGNCNAEVEDDLDLCWKCGTGKDGSPPDDPEAFADNRQNALELAVDPGDGTRAVGRPHNFYDFIADALFALAGLTAIGTVIMAVLADASSDVRTSGLAGGAVAGLTVLFYGALTVFTIAALAAILRVALDIEWNTRPRE